mgnify:CR=1 FL=1
MLIGGLITYQFIAYPIEEENYSEGYGTRMSMKAPIENPYIQLDSSVNLLKKAAIKAIKSKREYIIVDDIEYLPTL